MQNMKIPSLKTGIVPLRHTHTANTTQSGLKSDTHAHIRHAVCLPIVKLIEINLPLRLCFPGPHLVLEDYIIPLRFNGFSCQNEIKIMKL